MSEQTPAEEAHRAHVKANHDNWPGQHQYSPWCCFEAGMKQAEDERDSLKAQMQEWMEGSAQLQVKLDEAVEALEKIRLRVEPGRSGSWTIDDAIREVMWIDDECRRFAGLSTITPEDWAGHLRERAAGGGKTVEALREKYRLAVRQDVPSESKPNAEQDVQSDVQLRRR